MFTGTYGWFPNWMNTYQALIIPSLSFGLPLCVWNLTAYFVRLPGRAGALRDGGRLHAGPGVSSSIIVPLAAPGVFTTRMPFAPLCGTSS